MINNVSVCFCHVDPKLVFVSSLKFTSAAPSMNMAGIREGSGCRDKIFVSGTKSTLPPAMLDKGGCSELTGKAGKRDGSAVTQSVLVENAVF